MPPIAADYPLLDLIWTMFVFFAFVIWIMLVFKIFGDIFRREDVSGWGKAGWSILIILVPFLGVLIYVIAQGPDMAKRDAELIMEQSRMVDAHIRDVAGSSAVDEIEAAERLLKSGAISKAEFDAIKAKALA